MGWLHAGGAARRQRRHHTWHARPHAHTALGDTARTHTHLGRRPRGRAQCVGGGPHQHILVAVALVALQGVEPEQVAPRRALRRMVDVVEDLDALEAGCDG
jgi:hypothetical protein